MRTRISDRRPARWEHAAARTLDLLLACGMLLILAAPMLLVGCGIRLSSPGPALFRQRRVGRDRKPFVLYKFRTMRGGGDDAALRVLIAHELAGQDTTVDGSCKLAADQRVTRIGALLRRSSIDELPQLINVVRADMSLVGPRPCLEWEAELFPDEYAQRYAVRPGLTGLWQVSGRSTTGTVPMLRLDRDYARGWSLKLDIEILLRTIPVLLRRDGAR